jgi:hypothetical protein
MQKPSYRLIKGALNPLFKIMTQEEVRKAIGFGSPTHFSKCVARGDPIRANRRRWIMEIWEQILKEKPDFDKLFEEISK